MSQKQIQIPKGWELKTIRDILKDEKFAVVDGPFGTQLHVSDYVQNGIPLIRIKNILWNHKINSNDLVHITEEKFQELKRSAVFPNDILLAKTGGTIGKLCLFPPELKRGLISSSCAKISIDTKLADIQYVLLFLSSNLGQSQIIESARGGTRNSINNDLIRDIVIPIPSLPTQKKIAQKLDQILGQIEEKKQEYIELEKNQANLVLLNKKLVESVFLNQITNNWNKKLFGELILESKNGVTGSPNNDQVGVKRLGIETVTQSKDETVDINHCKFFNASTSDIERYSVKKDDLFVCRQNGNKHFVGKFAIYKDKIDPLIYSDSLIRFRVDTQQVLSGYIVFFMNSLSTRTQIDPFCKTQAGNYSINSTNLKKIIVDFPQLDQQKKILEQSKTIQNHIQIIRQTVNKIIELKKHSSNNLNSLETSILNVAFSGKLVK